MCTLLSVTRMWEAALFSSLRLSLSCVLALRSNETPAQAPSPCPWDPAFCLLSCHHMLRLSHSLQIRESLLTSIWWEAVVISILNSVDPKQLYPQRARSQAWPPPQPYPHPIPRFWLMGFTIKGTVADGTTASHPSKQFCLCSEVMKSKQKAVINSTRQESHALPITTILHCCNSQTSTHERIPTACRVQALINNSSLSTPQDMLFAFLQVPGEELNHSLKGIKWIFPLACSIVSTLGVL